MKPIDVDFDSLLLWSMMMSKTMQYCYYAAVDEEDSSCLVLRCSVEMWKERSLFLPRQSMNHHDHDDHCYYYYYYCEQLSLLWLKLSLAISRFAVGVVVVVVALSFS